MTIGRSRIRFWPLIAVIGAAILIVWLGARTGESVEPAAELPGASKQDTADSDPAERDLTKAWATATDAEAEVAPVVALEIVANRAGNGPTSTTASAAARVSPMQLIVAFNQEERDAAWATQEEAALYQRISEAAQGLKVIGVQAECRRTICRLETLSTTEASMRDSGFSVFWAAGTENAIPTHVIFGRADGAPGTTIYQQRRVLETDALQVQ